MSGPEAGLARYAFDDATCTCYHGTTDISGTVTLTLPQGDYRFRSDKNGTQFWSGEANHCTVPGCTAVTITVGSQAMGTPAGGVASGYPLPDFSLLLLAPLAVAALGRRKRWQRWTWPAAGALLAAAVVSSSTALADTSTMPPESEQMAEVRVLALSKAEGSSAVGEMTADREMNDMPSPSTVDSPSEVLLPARSPPPASSPTPTDVIVCQVIGLLRWAE